MSTERRTHERTRDDDHDEEWRDKIQRALRDLRSLSHGLHKDCVAS